VLRDVSAMMVTSRIVPIVLVFLEIIVVLNNSAPDAPPTKIKSLAVAYAIANASTVIRLIRVPRFVAVVVAVVDDW